MLGDKIKTAREKQRYTQMQLAEMIGTTSGYISQIERGIKNPSLATLEKIAEALKIKTKSLL